MVNLLVVASKQVLCYTTPDLKHTYSDPFRGCPDHPGPTGMKGMVVKPNRRWLIKRGNYFNEAVA